ncbi:MAG: flagellar motor switch protein FliM [Clostridia bacterium]|nr:flagellar motor switch protein FliM [Clostridia bacterium]
MADILSQNEIDQLLQALNDGDADALLGESAVELRIKPYDFRTANRIPRDQIKTLHIIYENFARLLSTYLTGTLGTMCETNVAFIEEQTYFEFSNSVPPNSILAILGMQPLESPVLLRVSPELSYMILECLLGGMDMASEIHRNFTEIDLVILEKIIHQILPLCDESWEKVLSVNTRLDGIETSVQFAQIVPPNETIAIVTIGVQIGGTEGLINICIPQMALEPIAKILSTRLLNSGRPAKADDSYQETMLHMLQTTPIPLKAILAETTIQVSDLVGLQVGDVIQLEARPGDPVKVDIGHIPRILGALGTHSSHLAVQITDIHFDEGVTSHE